MFAKTRSIAQKYGAKVAVAATPLLVPVYSFAQATTAATAMDDAKTEILSLVAVAGAAFIAIALAGVGWNVGAKLIKRMGGKA